MTDLRKAAEMALDALEAMAEFSPSRLERQITALRQELAKPANEFNPDWDMLQPFHERIAELEQQLAKQEQEQEPAAYLCENAVGYKFFRKKKPDSVFKPIPLYRTPPHKPEIELLLRNKNNG